MAARRQADQGDQERGRDPLDIVFEFLAVDLGGRKVERIAKAGVEREAGRDLPVVLDEVLLKARAFLNLRVLQIDREELHLTEEKAGDWRAGVRRARSLACLAAADAWPPGSAAPGS